MILIYLNRLPTLGISSDNFKITRLKFNIHIFFFVNYDWDYNMASANKENILLLLF